MPCHWRAGAYIGRARIGSSQQPDVSSTEFVVAARCDGDGPFLPQPTHALLIGAPGGSVKGWKEREEGLVLKKLFQIHMEKCKQIVAAVAFDVLR